MAIRPATKIPTRFALDFGDRVLVDTRGTTFHQPVRGELPILVAIGTKPVAAVVMIFIVEAHRDAVTGVRSYLLDQTDNLVLLTICVQGITDSRAAAVDEFRPFSPLAVRRMGQRNSCRIAAVPGVLRQAGFLYGGMAVEGGRVGGSCRSSVALSKVRRQ
jgi:hypothetical protein